MEETSGKVSVIVPVYNVAPFVEKCIESIRNQEYVIEFPLDVIANCLKEKFLKQRDSFRKFISERVSTLMLTLFKNQIE